jgi:hypothetical protein
VVFSDGATELVLCVCDLLGVGRDMVAAARGQIAEATGIPAEQVLVAATHTHSGPSQLRRADGSEYVGLTARRIAGAVGEARARLRPVRLRAGRAEVRSISQNRRHPRGPVSTTATIVLATGEGDDAVDDTVVGTIVNFACHATVLEHDNMEYSADFPGAVCRSVEREVGGQALYLQGACGDVNPVWMHHDHAEVARVGGILGSAAARVVHELQPLGHGQWVRNLSWSEDLRHQPAPGDLLTPVPLAAARTTLELARRPGRPAPETEAELEDVRGRLAAAAGAHGGEADDGGDGIQTRRRLTARRNELEVAAQWARARADHPGRSAQDVEVQAFRLARRCGVVSLPGEFFVATARDIVARAGVAHLLVAGYANGSVGYVPTADAFPESGYEVGMTQFGPEAAAVVADAAVATVRSLFDGGPDRG